MRSTTLYKLTIIWLALWFGVIVPGHTRGVVRVPGAEPPPQPSANEVCPLAQMFSGTSRCGCPKPSRAPGGSPLTPAGSCAICQIIAVLNAPDPVDVGPPSPQLLDVLPWPAPRVAQRPEFEHIYFGRGPPAA